MNLPTEIFVVLIGAAAAAGWVAGSWFTERSFDRLFEKLLQAFAALKTQIDEATQYRDPEDWWRGDERDGQ